MGWIQFLQFRCIKYGFTNYKKTARDLVASAQWDVRIEFFVF